MLKTRVMLILRAPLEITLGYFEFKHFKDSLKPEYRKYLVFVKALVKDIWFNQTTDYNSFRM